MVNVGLLVLVSLLILSGCDPFYGPKIRNSYGFDVEVTIVYSNGESLTANWPPCRTAFVGRRALELERVSIAKDGAVIREFTVEEIRDLVRKEEQINGYSAWSISEDGVSLTTGQSDERCIEGKPKSSANGN